MVILLNKTLFICCHISFIWAAYFFFKVSDENAKRGKKLVSLYGGLSILIQSVFIFGQPNASEALVITSNALFLLTLVIFWTSIMAQKGNSPGFAYSKMVPQRLITQGPYRLVRHPFYLSYSLAWIAGTLSTHWALTVTVIGMFFIYRNSALEEENNIIHSDNSSAYVEYKKKTKMFIPFVY